MQITCRSCARFWGCSAWLVLEQRMASAQPLQDQILAHTVYYTTSKCPIKDDVTQLAACWKSGSGALTKQEAGLLLWYHSQRGEDGCAEVLGSGVLTTCLDVLDSSTALPADKSTAAGLLLSLCADDKAKEQLAKGKASGANSSGCCQVLHGSIANPETAPRHVMALLACLASNPTSLSVLLRSLGGAVPWGTYCRVLDNTHKTAKDHTTAVEAAKYIQQLVSGREVLAADAAAAGVLESLLAATTLHKSAAAVCAGANCLLELCLAAPELRKHLGQLPGAVQKIVDLLGPPPATIIAWEQQHMKQSVLQSPHPQPMSPGGPGAAVADPDQQHLPGKATQQNSSNTRTGAGSAGGSGSSQHVRLTEHNSDSMNVRSRSGFLGSGDGLEAEAAVKDLPEEQGTTGGTKARRKSLRILNVAEGEAVAQAPAHTATGTGDAASSPTLRSKSLLGCLHKQATTAGSKAIISCRGTSTPALHLPPLSTNSTALKWEAPVSEATRTAAAGLLVQLLQLPNLQRAVSDRLAASRLSTLLNSSMQELGEAAGKKAKSGGKKGGSRLALTPETEQLLTHICVCLELLVAAHNADCFRVAAAGCLPALVQLAAESTNTHLRRAAKAVVAQVVLLAEVQQYVQQAQVPEEMMTALSKAPQVWMKLNDRETRQLLVEFPASTGLHVLDDVTARARC